MPVNLPLAVVGCGMAAPSHVEDCHELSARVTGRTAEWMEKHTGVVRRHVANADEDVADLAAEAAREALGNGPPPDLIINASAGPRQTLPDNSVFIAQRLGLEPVTCFSVHSSCISFLVALHSAAALIAAKTYSRILIVSAEICSRTRNFDEPESAALLGDGAGAIVVERGDGSSGILYHRTTCWPSGAALTEIKGGGNQRHPLDSRTRPTDNLFHMDGPAVFRLAGRRSKEFLSQLVRETMPLDAFDLIVPHQMSRPGLEFLKRTGMRPERVVDILAEYGNCAAASIPMALCCAMRERCPQKGDHVLLVGTAAGFSIGCTLLRW